MKELLEFIAADTNVEELCLNTKELQELFFPPFQKVKDCIIISEKNIKKLEAGFDYAVKVYTDKTGYEASNTETRINCYFENEISMVAGTKIAQLVIDIWALKLKSMAPDSKFCFIMCSDEDHVEIRFHQVRDDETRWLANDLEKYTNGAVGYIDI